MIEYRRPRLDEAVRFGRLHVQCWREAYTDIIPQDVVNQFDEISVGKSWQAHLSAPGRFVLAAYDGNEPVGFINQGAPVEDVFEGMDGHVAALYVAASHYRHGIGRKLLADAAKYWVSKGGHSLALGVLEKNLKARAFYEAMGGCFVKSGIFTWHGHDLPDVIYVFNDLPALFGKD